MLWIAIIHSFLFLGVFHGVVKKLSLYITDPDWKQPNVHQQMNEERNCGPFTPWNTPRNKKE